MSRLIGLIALILCLSASIGAAHGGTDDDDFRRGLTAFNAGDYETALQVWRALAEKNEPRSLPASASCTIAVWAYVPTTARPRHGSFAQPSAVRPRAS